ncbi:MerR family transcriptional regulator [Levilactobacillus bambusae]|uniref:MerR family transcriptional regulator n=1 Tax=Levilactobacillus bambusae TaxID=2024736 RepID=A0A2V1N291_9LACO|nr:MerR family transcriptional regulator [Levilactobacillus bambusae]PWG00425.1 MerR family transcriptional regulator [Levilactobacillus bambusae]
MTYTIKQAAEKSGLSIYTLRFYDKEGLLPFVARNQSGYREFTDGDLNLIHTICCLKNTGMKISAIRTYIDDVMAGPQTVDHRRELLTAHRDAVLENQRQVAENLKGIDFKLALYEDPNALALVQAERDLAEQEKRANHLENPYAVH